MSVIDLVLINYHRSEAEGGIEGGSWKVRSLKAEGE